MVREMAETMERERDALGLANDTVKAQGLTIEKLGHRLARLLRVQFGRSSEQMDQLGADGYRPAAPDVRRR